MMREDLLAGLDPVLVFERAFLATPEAREKLLTLGVEASPSTPDEFTAQIKSDVSRIGKMVKEAGIRAD